MNSCDEIFNFDTNPGSSKNGETPAPPPSPESCRKKFANNAIKNDGNIQTVLTTQVDSVSNMDIFGNTELLQERLLSLQSDMLFDDDIEMECEDEVVLPPSFNIKSAGCQINLIAPPYEQSPRTPNNFEIMMTEQSSLNAERLKKNSLKRRTMTDKNMFPYPVPGREDKKSRSARSSPPFMYLSSLSQSAPR